MVNEDEKSAKTTPLGLRMQPKLRAEITKAAKSHLRSINNEIVVRLEESFDVARARQEVDMALDRAETAYSAIKDLQGYEHASNDLLRVQERLKAALKLLSKA